MARPAKTERFEMRLDPGILADVDAWRGRQRDFPSRSEAVRRLIDAGLARPQGSEIKFSDGEKLITLMFCKLYKQLKIESEIDPTFVEAAIHQGNLWALAWQYSGIFHGHEASKATLHEVINILDMCSLIERGYGRLSKKDKSRLRRDAGPAGKHVVFGGFDGNSEGEHLGVAHFLINELEHFSEFKGCDLDSHCPLVDGYRRMWSVFEPIRNNLIGQQLSAAQIVEILEASRRQGS
jgi:uncharacterized protein YfbU (UPF0304 family)